MEVSRYLYNMNITLQIPSPRLWVYWTIREARLLDCTRESGTEMLTWRRRLKTKGGEGRS